MKILNELYFYFLGRTKLKEYMIMGKKLGVVRQHNVEMFKIYMSPSRIAFYMFFLPFFELLKATCVTYHKSIHAHGMSMIDIQGFSNNSSLLFRCS